METTGYLGAILAGEGLEPAGTCFQLAGGVIVTAAHVLADIGADAVSSVVWVRALAAGEPAGTARVAVVDVLHDLAVLITDHRFPGAAPRLWASDLHDSGHAVRITGVAEIPGEDSVIRSLDVRGSWEGGLIYEDGRACARVSCSDVMRGMSGAPVRRREDDVIIGVVSGRYNSTDGWLRDSVWVARTEDLRPLLAGLTTVTVFGPPILDPLTLRHWEQSEGKWFRGRKTALREIMSWLDRPKLSRPDCKILVVAGSPGAGKSAVLGRIVLTAAVAHENPDDPDSSGDGGPRARAGLVDCAVHATGKTALEIAREIACAASVPIPQQPRDLAHALKTVLARPWQQFNLIIDALDEASNPAEARAIVRDVLVPIAENCGDVGAQVVVGTRRFDGQGNLLDRFPSEPTLIDLDESKYFELADLAAYVQATLQRSGAEQSVNQYHDDAIAGPVAKRIAELADKNFLFAGLVAHHYAVYDERAKSVDEVRFVSDVVHLLTDFLRHLPSAEGIAAARVLRALAYIQAPGVPLELWQTALRALTGQAVQDDALWEFAQTSAANFLIEETDATTALGSVFRLFHQALNDALLHRVLPGGEAKLTAAFISYGCDLGWGSSPAYLLRSLPDHAARAGLIDVLLADTDYTLHADLRRLISAATAPTADVARQSLTLLRRTPEAFDAPAAQRLAMFSVTEAFDCLDTGYRQHVGPAPYQAVWASVTTRIERATLTGHTSGVTGVCAVRVDGRDLLASASHDGTVRIWDPATGTQIRQLTCHTAGVRGICAVQIGHQNQVVSVGNGTVRIWDPVTGTETRQLTGHNNRVTGVSVMRVDGRDLLASASWDGTVRIWDPATGAEVRRLTGHTNFDQAVDGVPMYLLEVYGVRVDDRDMLVLTDDDGTVRIWDPVTDAGFRYLTCHTGRGREHWNCGVRAVCAVRVNGQDLLVTAGKDGTVRIWDPATGAEVRRLTGRAGDVTWVCAVGVDGRDLLASASWDGVVRIWDPATGAEVRQLTGHVFGHINGMAMVCPVRVDGRDALASAGVDGTVRIWDPAAGIETRRESGHAKEVTGVCAVQADGRNLLASAGGRDRTVRIWDPATGAELRQLIGHTSNVAGVCAVCVDDRDLLASAGFDGTVRVWDPVTGSEIRQLTGHTDGVLGVCTVRVDGRDLLATAGGLDETVRIWDPAEGTEIRQLSADVSDVRGVCAVRVGGRDLLATAGARGEVRIWDPVTGNETHQLIGPERGMLLVARNTGVFAVRIDGRDLLAVTSGEDGTVRIWDPTEGTQTRQLTADAGFVTGVCAVRVDGRDLLATGGYGRTVQIWDLVTGGEIIRIPTYAEVNALITINEYLVIGLGTGLLTLLLRSVDQIT